MTSFTVRGGTAQTVGELPPVGATAPAFTLAAADLSDISLADLAGQRIVLNIFPSVDTGVCAASVRRFNELAASLEDTTVICVSKDLPFALGRFCGAEGIERVMAASAFRSSFGEDYGITQANGPLAGLFARGIVVLDRQSVVLHSQINEDLHTEPDYEAVLAALAD
ncbi:putative thiol peroxidase [Glutamicibacter uratoxydans]|uniref:Thiol peroxidase n=1 Tax=Glutamicibacter uratoxydans TaxID=43667 RepID=A0A4Y4DUR8_GLUUR|nr:thiol peroxidase [Glutamicibacter uratoxydans]GED06161.1 putative thiol peroxidase [Glutamicibacter uratoxydans]